MPKQRKIETPQVLWSLAAGFGALLGHANPWFQFPPAVLLLPAALAMLGFDAPGAGAAFRRAWLAGTLAGLACLYWVYWPVHHYGGVNWLLAAPVPVLFAMALAVYHGLFGLLAHACRRRLAPPATLFCLSVGWLFSELAAGNLFSGFPWLMLAGAFTPWPVIIQPAAYIGAYGLSGLLALIALGFVLSPHSRSCGIAAALTAFAILGTGWWHMRSYAETTPGHTVAVVQGNIDQSLKWDPEFQQATVTKYLRLSRRILATAQPELIVWPETAMPFYFQNPGPLRDPVLAFQRAAGVSLLLGSPAYDHAGPRGCTLFNRAFLLTPGDRPMQWYDKEHLVPFGEYMPLAGILPFGKLAEGVGDFSAGHNARALQTDSLALGVLLCYEAIFPEEAQTRVEQGATLLVNISNDAWFGRTSAPLQHLHLAALRAVEQGRWLVRSTNTGISAFIDPLGRIRRFGPEFKDLTAAGVVHGRSEFTIFHRLYGALFWFAGALALAALLVLFSRHNLANPRPLIRRTKHRHAAIR